MNGREHGAGSGSGAPPPGSEEWARALLRAEAERHDPDLTRIRRRIGLLPEDGDAAVHGRTRRSGRSVHAAGSGRRRRWGSPASAAGFAVAVTVAGIAVAGGFDVPSAGGSPGSVSVLPSPAPVTSAEEGGATEDDQPTQTGDDTAPPKDSRTTPSERESTSRPPAEERVKVQAVDPRRAVEVGGPAGGDWIVAGARQDGTTVHRERGIQFISGPHVTGHPTVSVPRGPFVVSWSGGTPERSGERHDGWLSVRAPENGPPTGFLVSAPGGHGSELTLYLGVSGSDARLQVRLGADGPREARTLEDRTLRPGDDTRAYVVTIRMPSRASRTVDVRLEAGSGGAVGLAAATLR